MENSIPTIIRNGINKRDFTIIANSAIRDKRLSFKARGIHHLLLSMPQDWIVRPQDIANRSDGDGITSVYSALKELREYGYATMRRVYSDGKIVGSEWTIYEIPINHEGTREYLEADIVAGNLPPGNLHSENLNEENLNLGNLHSENRGINKYPVNQVSSKQTMAAKTPPNTRVSKLPDPRRNHPAVKAYRGITSLQVPKVWLAVLINAIGDDPAKLLLWDSIVKDWIGYGWNKGNIKGMIEALQAGGLSKNSAPGKAKPNRPATAPVVKTVDDEIETYKRLNGGRSPGWADDSE